MAAIARPQGDALSIRRELRLSARVHRVSCQNVIRLRPDGTVVWPSDRWKARPFTFTDVLADPEYTFAARRSRLGGFRTVLGVPLLREGTPDRRHRAVQRNEVRPFTDKQIELVDHLRRPGGDRDRERAAVRRGAGAHARADRGAGAADRDLGGAAASSAARPASWSRCSRRCWRTRCGCARPNSAILNLYDGEAFPRRRAA